MKIKNVVYKLKEIYRKLSVPQFTIVTGLIIIIFGTLILSSPLCSSSDVGLWEAFFTSTSAITVTGLTIIDVGVDLNIFGQIFLALMLLSGGLGLMAITTFLQGFVVKGTQLRTRLDKGKTLDEFGVGGIGRTFQSIAITATSIISFGAIVLYFFGFLEIQNNWQRLWSAIFHSISAYNNAGFSLWSKSLQDYRSNFVVNVVFIFLIVMGGLGWRVIDDIWSNRKNLSYKKLSLHSRLVIRTSFSLIIFGSLGFFITETLLNSQFFSDLNFFEKVLSSIFETVSARTAGFTNFPISLNSISDTGLLLLMTLMFIGASTGGTGGGIKTTTFIALMAATRSTLRGQKDVIISNRLISDKVILKAVGITVGSLLFVLLMAMLLSTTNTFIKKESFTFLEILFTCISAFATVGFDIGLTAKLNHFGQFILIIGMFVGRLGILLLLSALWQALYKSRIERQKRIGYPKADLYV
ncbi:possible sodium transporter, Trk family [Prochlorococcus marinus subsp. pastoris str. CCMP1986]|uniref:Possible sodium transporter, Trk family n=1 Tax=Prochlorococcus marinus subsp. pastoris (strain CCMP1986 / NIES-2087 / MED4) TaxID=59919 RepID=Q7V3J1_PROMP|nr:potassium transporter TrkG [Prochlorococcus marinus]KGF88165.1 Potassium uptake protein TrkH [Prochlorococcus marinus str. EQPAC1]CAE18543.1 possible sodium transporter, Trk family [Prochlorococcus marinus subsp. pastoris str. CCMP1986]